MGIVTLLLGIPAAVLSAFLVRDLYACTGHFQRWILHLACKLLPLDQRDEKYKQWYADLQAVAPSEILRTFYALDCVRAAAVLSTGSKLGDALVKRSLDVLIGGSAIFLIGPLLCALAISIRIETRGPILFSQLRTGLRGRPIRLLKFRTMRFPVRQPGEIGQQPQRTKIGAWLRQLSFDELPQLINVVRGEMSLVGPKPMTLTRANQLSKNCPEFKLLHAVKPGITGWAQINRHLRNPRTPEEEAEQSLLDDLYYVRNRSVGLDLLILLRTVSIVLAGPLRK